MARNADVVRTFLIRYVRRLPGDLARDVAHMRGVEHLASLKVRALGKVAKLYQRSGFAAEVCPVFFDLRAAIRERAFSSRQDEHCVKPLAIVGKVFCKLPAGRSRLFGGDFKQVTRSVKPCLLDFGF